MKPCYALDRLKELGFKAATWSGTSIGITDMIIPDEKKAELEKAYVKLEELNKEPRPRRHHRPRNVTT